MPDVEFWWWLQDLPLSMHIGGTWWFPLLESIHVLAIAFVVGSIAVVDLRLLGVAASRYAVSSMSREVVPWTWGAFAVSTVTGLGMFITRPTAYVENPAFQLKLVLLALAGANVLVVHRLVYRGIESWDGQSWTPLGAKFSGGMSLLIWVMVVLAGRWTGHLN